jgi:sarcosine oxidase delta subunit
VTIRFPRGEDPESVGELRGMVWNSYLYSRQNHASEYREPVRHSNQDGTVDYTLVVHKPKLFRSYGIVWEQPDS